MLFEEHAIDAVKANFGTADEQESNMKKLNIKNDYEPVNDFDMNGKVSDEVSETIENVKKLPERKRKMKKASEVNARKKSAVTHKTNVNETFQ